MKTVSTHPYEETLGPEEVFSAISPDMRVAFILINKFTLAPVAGLVESLRFAADKSFRSLQIYCKWDWITLNNVPVVASCGLTILPTTDFNIENLKKNYDYVVVAGGLMSETREPPQVLLDTLKEIHANKIPIIALCSACFVIAKAGILDHRKCAVHFTIRDEFVERFPKAVALIDKTYIEDRGVFTCPGGTAIDLAANLIRQHCGDVRAQKGLEYLLMNGEKPPKEKQAAEIDKPDSYENITVSRAIEFMSVNLSAHVTLKEVADHAQTNPRQLHRVFVANTNESPASYWRRLRLEHARKLLANTSAYVTTIAIDCGFCDASHFIYWFKKQYGETPFSYRKRRHVIEKLN